MKKILDYLFRKLKLKASNEDDKTCVKVTIQGYGKKAVYTTKTWNSTVLKQIIQNAKEKGITLGWIETEWVNAEKKP